MACQLVEIQKKSRESGYFSANQVDWGIFPSGGVKIANFLRRCMAIRPIFIHFTPLQNESTASLREVRSNW